MKQIFFLLSMFFIFATGCDRAEISSFDSGFDSQGPSKSSSANDVQVKEETNKQNETIKNTVNPMDSIKNASGARPVAPRYGITGSQGALQAAATGNKDDDDDDESEEDDSEIPREIDCSDGMDNDLDGPIDCADPDCDSLPCDDGQMCSTVDLCLSGSCVGSPPCMDNEEI